MNKKIPRLNKGDLTGQAKIKFVAFGYAFVVFGLFIGVLGFGGSARAADIYVDQALANNCIVGNYSTTNRNCSGSDGDVYTTVQAAISAMNPGDHIYLRGGTYQEGHIDIPPSKNGDSWEEGHYNKLCSYPGEWAILDGNNSCADTGTVLGHINQGSAATHQINYWWFEKFEIKHGTNLNTEHSTDKAGGFWGMVGPFKFRYMYIHDNVVPSYAGANPGGIKGDSWRNSLIEYCYFNNNGVATGTDANAANVLIYADYNDATIAEDGFDIEGVHWPAYNNTIRYNYFVGSVVGFKMKNEQLLSGRNPGGGHGFDDTYDTYGNDIHHNIFEDTRDYAIGPSMDFSQVYNNIIYDCARGIWAYKSYRYGLYKIVTYNNSIINTTKEAIAYFKTQVSVWETDKFVGYNYNNIFDNCTDYNSWGVAHALNISYTDAGEDLSDYYITDNYFYRPDTNDLFRLNGVGYTASEFESQVLTHTPRNAYVNSYNGEDFLYQGSSGADKYKTRGDHLLEGSITITNGGIGGGAHPYLAGITIPSYIGATNPNDNVWVDGVLSLTDTNILMNGGSGDPNWIEGATDLIPPSLSNPQPTGTLSSGTTSTTISLDTDETAICKYSETAGIDYDSMTLQLSFPQPSSGQATHSATVSDLEDGNSYTYYARCQDESNNQNTDDFEISFSIASSTTYSISNFINLVTDWLKSESGLTSDVNGDGVVNTRDLGIMMSNWSD